MSSKTVIRYIETVGDKNSMNELLLFGDVFSFNLHVGLLLPCVFSSCSVNASLSTRHYITRLILKSSFKNWLCVVKSEFEVRYVHKSTV